MFDATNINPATWDKCFPCRRKITEDSDRAILAATKIEEPFTVTVQGVEIPGNAGDVLVIGSGGHKWILSPESFKKKYDILGSR